MAAGDSLNDLARRFFDSFVSAGSITTLPTAQPIRTASAPVAFALAADTSTQLLAANTARRGATIYNKSGQPVFIRYGSAVSSTLFTVAIADGATYEIPERITAAIFGLSTLAGAAVAAGVGLFVTEYTS